MIRLSVFYPSRSNAWFDWNYYTRRHLPMIVQRLGDACIGLTVDKGISGRAGGSEADYLAMLHLTFPGLDAIQTSFEPHAEAFFDDVPRFTDVLPFIQISEAQEPDNDVPPEDEVRALAS